MFPQVKAQFSPKEIVRYRNPFDCCLIMKTRIPENNPAYFGQPPAGGGGSGQLQPQ